MSLFKGIKEELSFKKTKQDGKRLTTESERRILLIGMTVVLVIIAIVFALGHSVVHQSAFQSCKSIILSAQRYNCMYALANKTGNYSICSSIPTGQMSYQCIAKVAEKQNNVSICNKIDSNSLQYDYCVENVSYSSNNISYCTQLKGDNGSQCAFNIAKKNQFSSIDYCNFVTNYSQKSICNYIFYYNAAVTSNSPYYCSLLPNVTNSTLLTTLISKDYSNQSVTSSFDFLSISVINVTPMSYCYYNIAKSTNNKLLCGYTSGVISNECYNSFNSSNSTYQFTNISSICSSAPSYIRDTCNYTVFTEKAISEQNVSSCLMIGNSTYKDTCIVQLASKYNDGSYCSYISNDTDKQACYVSASYTVK